MWDPGNHNVLRCGASFLVDGGFYNVKQYVGPRQSYCFTLYPAPESRPANEYFFDIYIFGPQIEIFLISIF